MKLINKPNTNPEESSRTFSITADNKPTTIEPGTVIEGTLTTSSELLINGAVKGKVFSSSHVTLGKEGSVIGEINAETILIDGRVEGLINGKDRVVLNSKASLKGDINTKTVVIEAGALFTGKSKMTEG